MKKRSWNEQQLRQAAKESFSLRQVLHKLNLKEAGGNYNQIKKYLSEYRINIKHFRGKGWNKGLRGLGAARIPLEKILRLDSNFQSHKLKKRLFAAKLKSPQCEICGWAKKSADGRLPLELDHINGNSRDNRLENLRILCPNCHSLQSTHRGRNMAKSK
ncbi:MAG: HNH endonuclease signature motif containing protein [Patescibacteria group bacterium]|jgi:hypothetical protein